MSASELPQRIDHDAPVFVISVAAHLAGMHPQTLRTYDRMGLVSPRRTPKRGRRYSARDIARLRLIQRLTNQLGLNLAGVETVLRMQDEIDRLQRQIARLERRLRDEVASVHKSYKRELVLYSEPTLPVRRRN